MTFRPLKRVRAPFLAGAMIVGTASAAWAGGFYTPYHSTAALGTSLAGASARTDDPSFFFFNPAAAAAFDTSTVTVEARFFNPSSKISVQSASSPSVLARPGLTLQLQPTDLTTDGPSGEMADPVAAPSFFAALPLTDRLSFGIGGSAPFAVEIDADPGWAGRFHLLETEMTAAEVAGALAYKLAPWLTVSAGVQVQKFSGTFTKTEFGVEFVPENGLVPFEATGYLKGEDTSVGAIAGIHLEPREGTRIGIGYRSAITHELEGTAGLRGEPGTRETVSFDVDLPSVVSVGLEQRIGDRLRLFAEGAWIEWSRFEGFDISFASGLPNELRPQEWDDSWIAALGFAYRVRPETEVTAGLSYDTAVTSGGTNTLSPDGDRTMASIGFTHEIAGRGKLFAQYTHIFFDDAAIEIDDPRSGTLTGSFASSLDIVGLGLQLAW